MGSVLTRLKNVSSGNRRPNNRHDLEGAIDRAGDARDIARDLLRRLPEYTGSEDEDTARHDMYPHPPQVTHVHVHPQPSQPDHDSEPPQVEIGPVTVRGLPKWAVTAIVAIGLVAAAATAIASHFASK